MPVLRPPHLERWIRLIRGVEPGTARALYMDSSQSRRSQDQKVSSRGPDGDYIASPLEKIGTPMCSPAETLPLVVLSVPPFRGDGTGERTRHGDGDGLTPSAAHTGRGGR